MRVNLVIVLTQNVLVLLCLSQNASSTEEGDSTTSAAAPLIAASSSPPSETARQQTGRFVQINEQQKYQILTEPSLSRDQTNDSSTLPSITIQKETVEGTCKLGSETYSIGDKWHPDLPPNGIQVCVLCECIVHQKSDSREARVTCRRTAKDCKRIESCPFGEKPVAPPDQCCKSCPSHNILGEGPHRPLPATDSMPVPTTASVAHPAADETNTGAPVKNLPAHIVSDETSKSVANSTATTTTTTLTSNPSRTSNKSKIGGSRANNNKELNTKDSRLAFKSLESQNRFLPSSAQSSSGTNEKDHVNDVSPSMCKLGNDTYSIGESWKPNLPPFGIQVCVLCECVVRLRKSCYEAKVTCRRIANECPVIESCPDGKAPITAPGQCCKSCSSAFLILDSTTESSITEQTTNNPVNVTNEATTFAKSNDIKSSESSTPPPPQPPATSVRKLIEPGSGHLKVATSHSNFKDLPLCRRDALDGANSGSISKRSRGSTVKKIKDS